MAARELTASQNPLAVFQQYVLANLHYWQAYISAKLNDTTAMDRSRDQILRGLIFAIELQEAWPAVGELIETLAAYMERRGYWEAWHKVLSQALAVAQQANDQASVVRLSVLLARLSQRQSNFKRAVHHYRITIHLAHRLGDRYNEARACSNLGYLYIEQEYWRRAELLCCHALLIFEQLGSQHGQAHTENHLGSLYTRQGRLELGRQHFRRACDLWQSMGDDHGLMRGLNNLGAVSNDLELPDESLVYLEQALRLANRTGEETDLAKIYENMGVSYRLKGDPLQAENYARQAETIFRRFSNSVGLAEVWGNLGLAYLDQGRWSEAETYLRASLEEWRNLKNKRGEIKTLLYWVEYELLRGNHRQAVRQLADIEHLLNQSDSYGQNHDLQILLLKYRRHLDEGAGFTPAPIIT